MNSNRKNSCVVRGEPADPTVDNTYIGLVCADCAPALDSAGIDFYIDNDGVGSQRNYVRRLLDNPAFVTAAIRAEASQRVQSILSDMETDMFGSAVRNLRDYLQGNLNLDAYRLLDAYTEGHCGLSLDSARGCMLDINRTEAFLKALTHELSNLDKVKDSIEMIDAGCGPVPVFAVVAALISDKVKVTCLEVNAASALMAEDIVGRFALQDRVKVVVVDARRYVHNKNVDLLVSETMYTGLTEEPMIQVFSNLAPGLSADGVVIPKKIDVKAAMLPISDWRNLNLGGILTPGDCKTLTFAMDDIGSESVNFDFELAGLNPGRYGIAIASRVVVSSAVEIPVNASPITSWVSVGSPFVVGPEESFATIKYTCGDRLQEIEVIFPQFGSAKGN